MAMGVKLCMAFLLLFAKGYPERPVNEIVCSGDCTIAYVPAAMNMLEHGRFTIFDDLTPYAGRMPGYEWVLMLSTLFSDSSEVSFLFVIVLQALVAGVSMYFLTQLAYRIFQSTEVALVTFVLYGVSTYTSLYDIAGLTESLATSVFIIAFSLLLHPKSTGSYPRQFFVGLLLLFSFVLRQYMLPFFLLWLVYIIYTGARAGHSPAKRLLSALAFVLPLMCFEVYWVSRNLLQKQAFIPFVDSLYAGYDYPEAKGKDFYFSPEMKALADFVKSWGGDFIWWNPNAEVTAFVSAPPKSERQQAEMLNALPPYIYTTAYTKDSLIQIQKFFSGSSEISNYQAIGQLQRYTAAFKQEKPFHYHVYAPIRLAGNFVLHSGTYNLFSAPFNELNTAEKGVKLVYSLLYGLVLLGGFSGALLALFKNKTNLECWLLVATAMFIIVLVPFVIRRIEYRHFVISYPFFVVMASYFLVELRNATGRLKGINLAVIKD
jgi:hypothetical protein